MLETKYRQLVRYSAIYDVFATAAFATPWTFHLLHQTLGLISPLPTFEPMHIFFVNLLGCLVLVWSALRIWRPDPIFGAFDSVARGLFFFWQVYYLLVFSISPIVWVFAAFEFAFGISQAYGYWLLHKIHSGSPSNCKVVKHFAAAA
jgi:hypothetical protein